jgi:hypothetical protein
MAHLLGSSGFNSELADAGSWVVSDSEGATNGGQRASFTQKVKAIAANPCMSVQAKYAVPVTLYLNSRLTFSFNKTAECLSVIPRLGDDILGKLNLFNIPTHDYFKGMQRKDIEARIKTELPGFAHWLINSYTVDPSVTSSGRYRTRCYHSPELLHYARASQDCSELLGWLHAIFTQNETFVKHVADKTTASYPAAIWLQILNQTLAHNCGLKPNRLSAHFQQLSRQFPDAISGHPDPRSKVYMFKVNYNKLLESQE